jgi:hypothetical protein
MEEAATLMMMQRKRGEPLKLSRLLGGLTLEAEARVRGVPVPALDPEVPSADRDHDGSISMDEVVVHTRHAGFGFLVAFLSLVAIPPLGLGVILGACICLLGGQMLAGREQPWLPARLRRRVIGVRTLRWLAAKMASGTRWLEKLVHPRWRVLSRGWPWRFAGLGIIILGFGLALPLPLPGSNWIFIAPLLVYAVGLLEDDGVLLAIGHVSTLALIGAGLLSWHLIDHGLHKAWHWVSGLF